MNYVYHGSKTSGLKTIEPRISTHKQKVVYASTNPCIATIFLKASGGDLVFLLGGRGTLEKPAYLVERLPGVFNTIFNNSGSIYTLDAAGFEYKEGFWNGEVVADTTQRVIEEKRIENILEKLKKYEETGALKIYNYPNRPNDIPLDNRDLIDKYISLYNSGNPNCIKELLNIYPEFTEEVTNKLNEFEKGIVL
jgi:hypothetical protein